MTTVRVGATKKYVSNWEQAFGRRATPGTKSGAGAQTAAPAKNAPAKNAPAKNAPAKNAPAKKTAGAKSKAASKRKS